MSNETMPMATTKSMPTLRIKVSCGERLYLKLSKTKGVKNEDEVLWITNELTHDTSFFSKFYKLPKVDAPFKE